MSVQDHITGLFVAGLFYWFIDDELAAATCWKSAVQILNSNITCVGET
jgi:hypothetical protein